MRRVAILGAGMVPFGKYPGKTLSEIAWPAVKAAIEDSNIPKKTIEATKSKVRIWEAKRRCSRTSCLVTLPWVATTTTAVTGSLLRLDGTQSLGGAHRAGAASWIA